MSAHMQVSNRAGVFAIDVVRHDYRPGSPSRIAGCERDFASVRQPVGGAAFALPGVGF